MKVITKNKKAKFNYDLQDKYLAGISLQGSEVKSIKAGQITLDNSYVSIENKEAILKQAHISEFNKQDVEQHNPTRDRKLLLNKEEIRRIDQLVKKQNLTIIPYAVLIGNKGLIKIEIYTAKGKTKSDKRESEKEKEFQKIKKMY